MYIVCSDLEGVFVPEIWINVAIKTGIDELKLTTRDISDYDLLMRGRLEILKQHGLTLRDIQKVIGRIKPLRGAAGFLNWLRQLTQVIIVSDTFTEFADPLIKQLGRPTLFCHTLSTNNEGTIIKYNLRQKDSKRMVTEALQGLGYKVIAIGDSFNDISMLRKAEIGILYRPPENVRAENSDLLVASSYNDLKRIIERIIV